MPGNPIDALAIRVSRPDDALKISIESLLFSINVLPSAKDLDLAMSKFHHRNLLSLCRLHRDTGVTPTIALDRFEPSLSYSWL